jgi:hypothetical protein
MGGNKMDTPNRQRKTERIISCLTVFFFLASQAAYAVPQMGIDFSVPKETPSFLQISIPANLATVDDIYEAPLQANPKLVLHIQNAHANYDAQQKIKQLLVYLNKTYSIKNIFVEGATRPLDPGYLKFFPDRERNMKFADALAKEGELTGAELYLMDDDNKGVRAEGIEDPKLYKANYDALKKVLGSEATVNRYLNGYESRLEALSSKVFTPDMRRLLSEWQKFERGHRDFMPFVRDLASDAFRVLGIDLKSLFSQVGWPQMTRLLILQDMEKDMDLPAVYDEKEKLIEFLEGKKISPALIEAVRDFKDQQVTLNRKAVSQDPQAAHPRFLFERLVAEAGPKGFAFHDYPNFSLHAGYLILKAELDSSALFEEITKLFSMTLDRLAKNPHQKTLLALYRDEVLVRKLFSLELTRKDWKALDLKTSAVGMDRLVERLRELGKAVNVSFKTADTDFETRKINPKFREEVLSIYESAYRFYNFAHQRERVFYEKMNAVMEKSPSRGAVLITGGFHTDGITELLREHEVNYAVLTPRLSEKSDERLYKRTMLQDSMELFSISFLEAAAKLASLDTLREQGVDPAKTLRSELRAFQAVGEFKTMDEAVIAFNGSTAAQLFGIQLKKIGPSAYQIEKRSEVRGGEFDDWVAGVWAREAREKNDREYDAEQAAREEGQGRIIAQQREVAQQKQIAEIEKRGGQWGYNHQGDVYELGARASEPDMARSESREGERPDPRFIDYYNEAANRIDQVGTPFGRSMFDIESLSTQAHAAVEALNRIEEEDEVGGFGWEVVNGRVQRVDPTRSEARDDAESLEWTEWLWLERHGYPTGEGEVQIHSDNGMTGHTTSAALDALREGFPEYIKSLQGRSEARDEEFDRWGAALMARDEQVKSDLAYDQEQADSLAEQQLVSRQILERAQKQHIAEIEARGGQWGYNHQGDVYELGARASESDMARSEARSDARVLPDWQIEIMRHGIMGALVVLDADVDPVYKKSYSETFKTKNWAFQLETQAQLIAFLEGIVRDIDDAEKTGYRGRSENEERTRQAMRDAKIRLNNHIASLRSELRDEEFDRWGAALMARDEQAKSDLAFDQEQADSLAEQQLVSRQILERAQKQRIAEIEARGGRWGYNTQGDVYELGARESEPDMARSESREGERPDPRFIDYYNEAANRIDQVGTPFGRSMFDIESLSTQAHAAVEALNRIEEEDEVGGFGWEVVNGRVQRVDPTRSENRWSSVESLEWTEWLWLERHGYPTGEGEIEIHSDNGMSGRTTSAALDALKEGFPEYIKSLQGRSEARGGEFDDWVAGVWAREEREKNDREYDAEKAEREEGQGRIIAQQREVMQQKQIAEIEGRGGQWGYNHQGDVYELGARESEPDIARSEVRDYKSDLAKGEVKITSESFHWSNKGSIAGYELRAVASQDGKYKLVYAAPAERLGQTEYAAASLEVSGLSIDEAVAKLQAFFEKADYGLNYSPESYGASVSDFKLWARKQMESRSETRSEYRPIPTVAEIQGLIADKLDAVIKARLGKDADALKAVEENADLAQKAEVVIAVVSGKIVRENMPGAQLAVMLKAIADVTETPLAGFVSKVKQILNIKDGAGLMAEMMPAGAGVTKEDRMSDRAILMNSMQRVTKLWVTDAANKAKFESQAKALVDLEVQWAAAQGFDIAGRFEIKVIDRVKARRELKTYAAAKYAQMKLVARDAGIQLDPMSFFVLTGTTEMLDLVDSETLRATMVEREDYQSAKIRGVARIFTAQLSQDVANKAELLTERTRQVLERNGNRYRLNPQGLEAMAAQLWIEVMAAFSLAKSA